ncbi:MAG: bifunctional hydroxymethylpyrimidine kinase/phosphomethylpyrimidine kinase [Bryobacteraceae bacterium]
MRPVALTIAGSDPSGGAGVQADLKTFHQFGVYGEAVLTLVTVQNTCRVDSVECLNPELVLAQLQAVIEDIPPDAAKTGALGNEALVKAIANAAAEFRFPLVVDPVLVSKHGAALVSGNAVSALAEHLLPRAFLVTPNLHEAVLLTGMGVNDVESMRRAARKLCGMGARAALVKGGHLEGDAVDVLCFEGRIREFSAPRIVTRHTHGTGCTYSAAITAALSRGEPLESAVEVAKRYVSAAIATSPGLGRGSGPLNHHSAIPEVPWKRR